MVLIAGTSTGGIIALATGVLGLTGLECRQRYLSLAESVFQGNSIDKFSRMVTGNTIYKAENLEKFLAETFGAARLTELPSAASPPASARSSASSASAGAGAGAAAVSASSSSSSSSSASSSAAASASSAASAAASASAGASAGAASAGAGRVPRVFVVMRKNADAGPFLARNYTLPFTVNSVKPKPAPAISAASPSSVAAASASSAASGGVGGSAAASQGAVNPFAEFAHAGEAGWLAAHAARATSAAPLYFPPFVDAASQHCFSDGGVGYNNPSEIAYNEVCALRMALPSPRLFRCIVSIGTGLAPPQDLKSKMLINQVSVMRAPLRWL